MEVSEGTLEVERSVFVCHSNWDTSRILGDSDAEVLQCLELSYMMKNYL